MSLAPGPQKGKSSEVSADARVRRTPRVMEGTTMTHENRREFFSKGVPGGMTGKPDIQKSRSFKLKSLKQIGKTKFHYCVFLLPRFLSLLTSYNFF